MPCGKGGKNADEVSNGSGSDGSGVKLKREIGLFNAITIIVGSIIGSGIFISPKGVLENVGSPGASLILWFLCGVYCMIGAFCYAELATLIPSSGGDYTYVFKAFGPMPGFLRLWIEVIVVRPATYAVVALAFAYYIIEPLFPNCEQPLIAVRLLAAACIIILTFINCASVKLSAFIQDAFTIAKVLALIIIIITGLILLGMGNYEYLKPSAVFEGTSTDVSKYALGFYSGLFAYNGWTWLNLIVEEMINPERNFPIAVSVSLVLVMVVYLLTNVAYFTVISPAELLTTPAVAVMFAQRLYGFMWWIIPVFVAMSTFGSVNGGLLTASRLIFIGAREGHMPQFLNLVNPKLLTPIPAVILTGVSTCLYLVSSDVYQLINYASSCLWISIALSVICVLYFRKSMPDAHRPIKVPLALPVIFVVLTTVLVIFAAVSSPLEFGIGMLMVISGVPVYWICVLWQNKPRAFNSFMNSITRNSQILFMSVPEAKDKGM